MGTTRRTKKIVVRRDDRKAGSLSTFVTLARPTYRVSPIRSHRYRLTHMMTPMGTTMKMRTPIRAGDRNAYPTSAWRVRDARLLMPHHPFVRFFEDRCDGRFSAGRRQGMDNCEQRMPSHEQRCTKQSENEGAPTRVSGRSRRHVNQTPELLSPNSQARGESSGTLPAWLPALTILLASSTKTTEGFIVRTRDSGTWA